jgi:hypothetical protein
MRPDVKADRRKNAARDRSELPDCGDPFLLAKQGGQRGRKVPSPHWCPSPDRAGFLVGWAPPEFTSREPFPLDRIGPPWSAGPEPTGLTADPTVMHLVLSPSGRHLAIACSGGDARATAWHLGDRRCLALLPRGHALFRVEFLPDESAMVFVGASLDSPEGEIGILPLGAGEPRFIAFTRPTLAVAHPAGETLAVLDGRNRLSMLDLASGRAERVLFVDGIRPPIDAAFLLGPDYPRDWLTMAPEELDNLLQQKQDEILRLHEQQIRDQPIERIKSLRKKSRARIEMFGKHAREALATTQLPGWRDEKASSREFVTQLMFDPSGERLFAATFEGARVYRWSEVLQAKGEMPTPTHKVTLEPWLKETPEGPAARNSFVAALAYDPERDRLLFAGQEGRVRYLDLADGRTDILLEPPGRPAIGQLALSRDRSALGITCEPDINEEGRTRRSAVVQFWDYPALCARL